MSAPATCTHVTLAQPADGKPSTDNFNIEQVDMPVCGAGQILVRVLVLSVDPYMRGRIGTDELRSSSKPIGVGDVVPGATVGQVIESNVDAFQVGDIVHGYSGWRSHYATEPQAVEATKIHNGEFDFPLEKYVGILGMTGLTSYYGLTFVGKAKKGETVVVTGAAGAVGSAVCQLAKIYGCRVVGFAGSEAKLQMLREDYGVDVAISYKQSVEELNAALDEACPDGVDVLYDNTGGVVYDQVMPRINQFARIVICGQISDYNTPSSEQAMGPRLNHMLLWRSATMAGFLVQDFEEHDAETIAKLQQWMKEGKLKSREDVVEGIENAPAAFLRLFDGLNMGKQVVRVGQQDS